jgi:hypothetical protein
MSFPPHLISNVNLAMLQPVVQDGFNQFVGNTAVGSASTLLMLRTIAVWNRSPAVTVPLVLASLGQWAILFHGIVTVRSSWSDDANKCMLNHVPRALMGLMYMYSKSSGQFLPFRREEPDIEHQY